MEKTIRSFDGTSINYDISTVTSTKQWLVFIHGAGGDLTAWTKERQFFHRKGYCTIALDLRGHGKSERPDLLIQYDLDSFAKDVDAVLEHENIHNFSIIGHCFGGMITIMYHKLFPKRSNSYVLVDTTYKAPKALKRIFHTHPFYLNLLNRILEKEDLRKKHFSHADHTRFIGTGDYDPHRIISDIAHTSFKSWIFTYEQISHYDGIETIRTITQPVLIIEGEQDTIFTVMKAKKLHALIKNSTLEIIPKENHIIVLNNPRILNSEILKFVSSHET